MKKILCLTLCVLLVAAAFAGCGEVAETEVTVAPESIVDTGNPADVPETDPDEINGIHYKGLANKDISIDSLAEAEGRPLDAQTTIDECPMYIYNNVSYLDMNFFQLQCIAYGDKTTVTLTYTLQDGEAVETAMATVSAAVDAIFGDHTVSETSGGSQILTWRQAQVNENYICLYPNGATELKLCFYLY